MTTFAREVEAVTGSDLIEITEPVERCKKNLRLMPQLKKVAFLLVDFINPKARMVESVILIAYD